MISFLLFLEQAAKAQVKPYDSKKQAEIHRITKLPRYGAFQDYTSGSMYINDVLHKTYRNPKGAGKTGDEYDRGVIRGMDRKLDTAKIPKAIYVFTGVPESPSNLWKKHKVDPKKPIQCILPAYTSCTTDFNVADGAGAARIGDIFDYKNHPPRNSDAPSKFEMEGSYGEDFRQVLKIYLPKGAEAGSVKSQSQYKYENEIILHRDSIVEIDPSPTITKKFTVIWHCKWLGRSPHKCY